jgi:hypothetical protein
MNISSKTAKKRKCPSKPLIDILANYQIDSPIIDYGCGYGADVKYLQEKGMSVIGYDPNFFPTKPTVLGMTILNTYVLNVIDTKQNRIKIIKDMVRYCAIDGHIFISTRTKTEINSLGRINQWTPKSGGFLTKRGTFQIGLDTNDIINLFSESNLINDVTIVHKKNGPKYTALVVKRKK